METAYPETTGKTASDVGVTEEKTYFLSYGNKIKRLGELKREFYLLLIALLMQKPASWLELKLYLV
jgi:hypothetical protein